MSEINDKTHPSYYKDNNGEDLFTQLEREKSYLYVYGFYDGNIKKYSRRVGKKKGQENLDPEKIKVYTNQLENYKNKHKFETKFYKLIGKI